MPIPETNKTVHEIDRPYNKRLERTERPINNGSVESMPVKSDGALGDIWIRNFIKSEKWQPKKRGFYIDGKTGYAEFSNVFVSGHIEAFSGTIGGFEIGPTYIRDVADSFGLSSVAGAGEVRFWAGDTFDNRTIAPFRVLVDGTVYASSITIVGSTSSILIDPDDPNSVALTGFIPQNNLAIANQSWGQSCTFAPIDFNTVNWGVGVISFSDGNDYNISAGTTGNMATAKLYVYFDLDVSTTAYQQTANIANTTGPNKAIVAVITRNTAPLKATYQLFGGGGGIVVDGGSLTPGSVTYTELAYPPLSGAGAPSTTPGNFGQLYIDTAGRKAYIALGTLNEFEWALIQADTHGFSPSASRSPSMSMSSSLSPSLSESASLSPSTSVSPSTP